MEMPLKWGKVSEDAAKEMAHHPKQKSRRFLCCVQSLTYPRPVTTRLRHSHATGTGTVKCRQPHKSTGMRE